MNFKVPEKWKNILSKVVAKDKLLIILLFGVLLIIINIPVKSSGKSSVSGNQTSAASGDTAADGSMDVSEYVEGLETKLEKILCQTANVGEAKVIITVENGGQKIPYVQTNKSENTVEESDSTGGSRKSSESTVEESVIYTDDGENSVPFVVEEKMPEILGVLILAEGGDDAQTVSEITKAASALLGISVNKIKVLKMEA